MPTLNIHTDPSQYVSALAAYLNDNDSFSGTLSSPGGSVAAKSTFSFSTSFTLAQPAQFSVLYAYYQDWMDAEHSGDGPHWWSNGSGTPFWTATNESNSLVPAGISLLINGTNVTVQFQGVNPFATTSTYAAISIPFKFITYALTN